MVIVKIITPSTSDNQIIYRPVVRDVQKIPEKNVKSLAVFRFFTWFKQVFVSALIVSILIFIILNFYLYASVVNLYDFFYVFLIFSLLTDGIFILLQLLRKRVKHKSLLFNPTKVTAVIACYNGSDVIGDTIINLKKRLPAGQIIVVSDASTDNTESIARSLGVRVVVNEKNLGKVLSINRAIKEVATPYVLIMDDDVLIGESVIPTNLLDEGYTAVAFNVMPVEEDKFINRLQMFEYRNSMQVGKNLRGKAGAIGNVSGAIGLYRTGDLWKQKTLHSGQFAGEDEQRTLLAHLYSDGKGITYSDQPILTHAPNSYIDLFKQRAYSWSLAVPELFTIYWRILLSPKFHYLLKIEKAYYLYIYLTDPLRILFLWALFLRPVNIIYTYLFYVIFSLIVWLRLGLKDRLAVVLAYPFYKLWLTLCRFIGNFYWFKVKASYLKKRLHRDVSKRRLIPEYLLITSIFVLLWILSSFNFYKDMKLYNQIKNNKLDTETKDFEYDKTSEEKLIDTSRLSIAYKVSPPTEGTYIAVKLEQGDTDRAIAHKAVDEIAKNSNSEIPYDIRSTVDRAVLKELGQSGVYITPTSMALIDKQVLENSINLVKSTNNTQEVQQ